MESIGGLSKNYLEKIKKIEPNKSARTRNAELISRYLDFIKWDNKRISEQIANGKNDDVAITFMLGQRYAKYNGYEKLERCLKWIENKDLRPQQVWKVLTK